MSTPENKIAKNFLRFSNISAWVVIFTGLVVLVGWTFHITALKSILPSFVSMKANTALMFVLSGTSLLFFQKKSTSKTNLYIAQIIAGIVFLTGLLTFLEYLLQLNFGIDQIFFKEDVAAILTAAPGRMSANTAICFVLVGLSLLINNKQIRKKISLAWLLSFVVLMIALLSLFGYIYSQWGVLQVMNSTLMALHTAVLFLILSLGILFSNPNEGLMKSLSSETSSGKVLRYLIPSIFIFPLLVDLLLTIGISLGIVNDNLERVFHSLIVIAILFVLFWLTIHQNERSEEKLRSSEEKFRKIFDFSPVGIVIVGMNKEFIQCNTAFANSLSYSMEEIIGMTIEEITFPDDRSLGIDDMKAIVKGEMSASNFQKRYVRKDKQLIWADITISLIRGNDNQPKYFLGLIQDITGKKQYENELILKNIVFESSVSANSTADVSGILTNVNHAFLKMWGYEKVEEVLGRSLTEFIKFEDEATEIITSLNETGKWSGEYSALKKDKSVFNAQANASILIDADGHFIGYQSTVIDVTEKKKAEEERNQFFNITLEYLCVAGTDGYFKSVNPVWTKTFGFTEKELLSKPFFEFIHPEDVDSTVDAVSQLSKQNPVVNFINRYRCKDGSYRWLSWSATPQNDTIYAAAHDITDIKLAEEKLTNFNTELENIVKERTLDLEKNKKLLDETSRLARVGGWEIDLIHNTNVWTDAVYEIHETTREEHTPTVESGINFYTPEAIPIISDAVQKAITEGTPFDLELQIITVKKNIKWVRIISQSYYENNEVVKIGGVFQDINQKKLIEEELIQHRENLELLVKEKTNDLALAITNLERSNQELEQFAYIASHDLQEPLRMVSSYTQLLEKRYGDKLDQNAKEFIGYAVDGSIRMQRLINDLLDYSRVATKGKSFVKLDMTALLGYAVANLYSTIQETGTIITNDELPFCMGDESQLIRVFQNLLGNAIKFTKDKAPQIHVSVVESTTNWTIGVKDNGIGIDPQYQYRVFNIFQRLHSSAEYPGTGIGLAICKRIVERHGGTIWFESEIGKGTTFKFTLNKIQEV